MDETQKPPIIGTPPLGGAGRKAPLAAKELRRLKPPARGPIFGASIPVLRIAGISIRLHPTFLLLLAYVAWVGYEPGPGGWLGAAAAVALICLVFVCVCLHELGHSIVAQRFGVEVQSITLWPFGGVAALKRIPEKPLQELAITAAGPLVNLVIAVGLLIWLKTARLLPADWGLPLTFPNLLPLLFIINVSMLLFNLIPAFPMDGGRLLRALLAFWLPYLRATTIAATIGKIIAMLLIGVSLIWWPQTVILTIGGLFVLFAAGNEERIVKTRAALSTVRAGHIMRRVFESLSPSETVGDALQKSFYSDQEAFPVTVDGKLEGMVSRAQLLHALRVAGPETAVDAVMDRKFQTATPQTSGTQLYEDMLSSAAAALPVLEGGNLVGLVTAGGLNFCITMKGTPLTRSTPPPLETREPPPRPALSAGEAGPSQTRDQSAAS